jgi:hypothetical protein
MVRRRQPPQLPARYENAMALAIASNLEYRHLRQIGGLFRHGL